MGLRTFHIVFVTISTVMTFVFGGWCWRYAESQQSGAYRAVAMASFGAGAALIVYGFWFWKKINTKGTGASGGHKGAVVALVMLVWLLGRPGIDACTVCFGQAEGPMIDGARNGVWLLFGLVGSVQLSFAAFFVYLWRRGRELSDTANPEESTQP
jgi:hypothetical protein